MLDTLAAAMPIQLAIEEYMTALADAGITLRVRRNFKAYAAVRRDHGDHHLNQVFDPQYARFGDRDFWLLAQNRRGEAIATHCVRRFIADDFYDLIRSQALWFGARPHLTDPRFIVTCAIPPFGGEIAHGGGLWVRPDHRGSAKLAFILPRLARAIALRTAPFDHDSGMIRNDPCDVPRLSERKAAFMGLRTYGFARVHRFVAGWFPPEGREAIMHLCHATREEALASLVAPPSGIARLRRPQLGQRALVDQHEQLIDISAIRCQGQQQPGI
ncbi:MAG: hypothetical protein ACREFA_05095 [Stellaceae bacterium]